MSSRDERRQRKIPHGSYRREEVVNPLETVEVPSSSSARTEERSCQHETELMERVVSRPNMMDAYGQVLRNKGAAGIDGMRVQDLKPYLQENWGRIKQELLTGSYKPRPVRRVEIPKPDGGVRLLGIPTVLDRLIQQALHQTLNIIFDPGFSENSYGFRKGRSAKQGVLKAREYIQEGFRYVVDMDLAKFFDRVNHDMLMSRVARKVADKRVLHLVRAYLEAGVMIGGLFEKTEEGTPQGGPLSPLLANIMLDDLDKELEKRGHRFVRYADDCNIYSLAASIGRILDPLRRMFRPRCDVLQQGGDLALGDFGIVRGLSAQPIAVGQAEKTAQPQIRIGCHRAFPRNDFTDALRRNADLLGKAIPADSHRLQKLLKQNFPRRYGFKLFHAVHSLMGDYFLNCFRQDR